MAQLIEARTDLFVERYFNLGGTMICHNALVHGEIDLYAEYIGTGLTVILKHPVISDPEEALSQVRKHTKSVSMPNGSSLLDSTIPMPSLSEQPMQRVMDGPGSLTFKRLLQGCGLDLPLNLRKGRMVIQVFVKSMGCVLEK